MEFSPEKHQETDDVNKALVVSVDLTEFQTTSTIRFSPTPERCGKLIDTMEIAQNENYLDPRQAESRLGKMNFTLSVCPKGVGRASTQPLIKRVSGDPYSANYVKSNKFNWTPVMTVILIFFKALFTNIPPLEFWMCGANSSSIPMCVKTLLGSDWVCC